MKYLKTFEHDEISQDEPEMGPKIGDWMLTTDSIIGEVKQIIETTNKGKFWYGFEKENYDPFASASMGGSIHWRTRNMIVCWAPTKEKLISKVNTQNKFDL